MDASSENTIPVPGPLFGDRTVVRGYTDDDAPGMFEAIRESVDHLRPWMPWTNTYRTVEDSRDYIRQCQSRFLLRTDFPMAMFRRTDGRYLGGTGVHIRDLRVPSFEIGYWVRVSEEAKGYVSEAVRLLTTCAFDTLEAERVMIRCDARNERSRRVAEGQGYVFEGRQRNAERDSAGELIDMLIYSMIRADFTQARLRWDQAQVQGA